MKPEVTDPILTADDLGIFEVRDGSNIWVKKDGKNGSWMLTPSGFKQLSNLSPDMWIRRFYNSKI